MPRSRGPTSADHMVKSDCQKTIIRSSSSVGHGSETSRHKSKVFFVQYCSPKVALFGISRDRVGRSHRFSVIRPKHPSINVSPRASNLEDSGHERSDLLRDLKTWDITSSFVPTQRATGSSFIRSMKMANGKQTFTVGCEATNPGSKPAGQGLR